MPVLTSSEHLIPKSQLRHRPIAPTTRLEKPPCTLRASRTQTHTPLSGKDAPVDVPLPKPSSSSWWQHSPLVKIALGMLLTATLILLGQLATNSIARAVNDLRYGYPRISQIDAFVGGKIPSHFIALNLSGQIEVIEFPGGDASHARLYLGPQLSGPDADLVPVTFQLSQSGHGHQTALAVLVDGSPIVLHSSQAVPILPLQSPLPFPVAPPTAS